MGKLIDNYNNLSNEHIKASIESLYELGQANKADKGMLKRSALFIEEVMLNYQKAYGSDTEVHFRVSKRLYTLSVVIEVSGPKMNPMDASDLQNELLIMDSLDVETRYSYSGGVNRVGLGIGISNGKSVLVSVFSSIAIGILIGIFGKFLPDPIFNFVELVLNKTSSAIMGLINTVSMPVIFLCVIQGIIGSGNIESFKKNGRSTIKLYFWDLLTMLLISVAVAIPVLGLDVSLSSDVGANGTLVVESIFSLFPSNLLAPFHEGDNLKVLVIGIVVGVAIITLKDRMSTTINLVHELKSVFSMIMEWIVKLVPLLIIVLISTNIWSGNFGSNLLKLWKPALLYLILISVFLIYYVCRLIRITEYSIRDVLRIVLPVGLKAITTASSMMCYSDMYKSLVDKLGLPEDDVDFALPLAVALYQPSMVIFSVSVIYFMSVSGVSVGIPWIISLLLICFMLAIAVPPVCGAGIALMLAIFAALGVPQECYSIAIPFIMLADYPHTGWRVSLMITEVAYSYFNRIKRHK